MELLADSLRPTKLEDVIGQQHLVGEDKVIRNLVENNHIVSMILYGKPGIGKTAIVEGLAYRIQKGNVPEALENTVETKVALISIGDIRLNNELEEFEYSIKKLTNV